MKKSIFLKIIIFCSIVVVTYAYLNAIIVANEPRRGGGSSIMNDYIIEGTSAFLKSNADMFLLLNEVEVAEKQDFNFDYSYQLVVSAIEKLQTAKSYYNDAIAAGKSVSQDRDKIQKLINFKYEEFVFENRLNTTIMDDVKLYLRNGDFIGVYQKCATDMDGILMTLTTIKENLSKRIKPKIDLFWTLLQQFTTLAQRGNYATLVFYSSM